MNKSILLLLYISFSSSLIAQNDSLWIEKMYDKISPEISANNDFETFEIHSNVLTILQPNIATNLKFKLNYRLLSFGFQYAPKFIPGNKDDDIKGSTKSLKFNTSIIAKHWFSNLSYQRIKGYYLKNTSDYFDWKDGDPLMQFPTLQYSGVNADIGYSFNSRYSIKSITNHTERQLQSCGTFMPYFQMAWYEVKDIGDHSTQYSSQQSKNFEWSLGAGYFYSYVLQKKFFASAGINPSIGATHTKITTYLNQMEYEDLQDNLMFKLNGRFALGYNGSKMFTGIQIHYIGTYYRQQHTIVTNDYHHWFYQVYLGLRINAPTRLNTFFSRIENRYGLHKK